MSDQRPEPAVRKLCIKSNPTMEEIAAWDRRHNASKWMLPGESADSDDNDVHSVH